MAPFGFDLFTVISGIALIVMVVSLLRAIEFKKSVPGGVVGQCWNMILSSVIFFFVVYLIIPFFVLLPQETKDVIVAFIFLFGAIYVLISVMVVYRIIVVMKRQ